MRVAFSSLVFLLPLKLRATHLGKLGKVRLFAQLESFGPFKLAT